MAQPSSTVAAVVASVFSLLAALHVFWALGGKWGGTVAVPEVRGKPAFVPSALATVVVAVALATAALVVLAQAGLTARFLPPQLVRLASFVLGAVFVLRSVGEFRLIGFFKTVRDTPFARYDTLLYSPLALALGLAVLWLARSGSGR